MNVFGVGLPEIAVIGALALLIFGPKRLPELGRTLGKTLKGFQAASSEFEREIHKAMSDKDSDNISVDEKLVSSTEKDNEDSPEKLQQPPHKPT